MKNKSCLIFIITGIILICISISLLMYKHYLDLKAGEESHKVVEQLQSQIKESTKKQETLEISNNEYIGIINIPTLNLELPILSNWSYQNLKISPARYYGNIKNNDLVICAHSYKTLFRPLKKLTKGDLLIYKDISGNEYLYRVEVIEILPPEAIEEMIESEFDLTLFTCTNDNQNRVTIRLNQIPN